MQTLTVRQPQRQTYDIPSSICVFATQQIQSRQPEKLDIKQRRHFEERSTVECTEHSRSHKEGEMLPFDNISEALIISLSDGEYEVDDSQLRIIQPVAPFGVIERLVVLHEFSPRDDRDQRMQRDEESLQQSVPDRFRWHEVCIQIDLVFVAREGEIDIVQVICCT